MIAPWDYHKDLQEDRINTIAELLIQIRLQVMAEYAPLQGDTGWGVGCKAYDRCRSQIIRMAMTTTWLKILDASMHLIFSIGEVPVRMYRGDADEPTDRTLAQSLPELDQLAMAFPGADEQLIWRFAVETGADGLVSRVIFCGLTESGEVRCKWERQGDEPIGSAIETAATSGSGVELPKPKVGIPTLPKVASGEEK